MRKFLTAMLAVIAACCLTAGVACHSHKYSEEWTADETYHWHAATCKHEDEKSDVEEHTWVATGETDDNGYAVYQCSVCGYVHSHTFSSSWTTDKTAHWHASTCGHDEISGYEAHDFEDGVCVVCGYDESDATEYEIVFSYYTDDNESGTYGDTVTNSSGVSVSDTYRGVTYTGVEYDGYTIDITGDYMYKGESFAFTVTKSVFSHYTNDGDTAPRVYANDDIVTPDSSGVYIVEVEGDTIITVDNVEDNSLTIDGTGTETDPYTINSLIDWLYFANIINDKDYYTFDRNTAYWKLTCDLDFEGEDIYIIGDGYTTDYSMFCGNFDGDGHTISNFVIDNAIYDSEGEYSSYAGVFGILAGYQGVDTCIKNLTIENYTINAGASSSASVYVGGLVGFVTGGSIINCKVDGCVINVTADDNYGAIIGGITGICQSAYDEDNEVVYYSSIQYCSADVDISGSGYLYEAGGIVGRTYPASSKAPIFIFNCYTSGNYSNAAQTGGIAAYIGRYTSVQNCYSTATIVSQCTNTSSPDTAYIGTLLDYRYAYAGGIVGYAENDTYISGCFYQDGSLKASATSDSSYAKTGDIIAACSEAGFEDYHAQATIFTNNYGKSDTISNALLQDIGWIEADWIFSDSGYPTVNQETAELSYTVKISIEGATAASYTLSNRYMPMAYWYIAEASESGSGVAQYLTSATSTTTYTYGYFFDADCTEPVPSCYVPMGDVMLYAKYADYSEVSGTYYIYSNDISATLIINNDATYSFEYDAVYLEGEYVYNGTYLTFVDSYFSRLVSSATATQQAYSYTFWAELNTNGDLKIYDCKTVAAVSETYDGYGYTYVARLVSIDDPIVAMTQSHASIVGKYYDSTTSSNTFTLDIGYTGSATLNGSTQSLTYTYDSTTCTVELENGTEFTATVASGKITELKNSSDAVVYSLSAYDDFEGTWEQTTTINKKYTFDGKGTWTYYVNGEQTGTGRYTIDTNGNLTFTRDTNISVVVKLNDGTLSVTENSGVSVSYFIEGGYQGTWYTAAQQSNYYTMVLGGLTSNGYGELSITGSGLNLELRYVNDGGVLYAYSGDTLYAQLTYATNKSMSVLLYNSSTAALDTELTFFLYDNFYGDWFTGITDSSSNTIYKLTFNGFGLYNVAADTTANTMAVKGSVTIYYTDSSNNDKSASVAYSYSSTTGYTFTFNDVTYTISYDENTNTVTVTYSGGSATLIAGDNLYNVTYVDGDGYTYVFNGSGNLTTGGTVTITTTDNKLNYYYKIDSDGKVTIYSDNIGGTTYATATPTTDDGEITGYEFVKNSTTNSLKVSNGFSGTWAVDGGFATFEIPEIKYYVSGSVIELAMVYTNGTTNTTEDLTGYYDGSVVWFSTGSTTYYINIKQSGNVYMGDAYNTNNSTITTMQLFESDGYCATYTKDSNNKVVLAGDSAQGYGNAQVIINGVTTEYYYTVENGSITIYTMDTKVAVYTFNASDNGTYINGEDKRELVEVTAD